MTGEQWEPYEPAPFVARCNRCQRMTVVASVIGTLDQMPQPDGLPCGGVLVALPRDAAVSA